MMRQLILLCALGGPSAVAQQADVDIVRGQRAASQSRVRTGLEVLEQMFAARERISAGTLDIVRLRNRGADGRVGDSVEQASFRGERHRVDILEHSDLRHMFDAINAPVPDRLQVTIWDGAYFLREQHQPKRMYRTLHSSDQPGFPTYNARWIGFPVVRPPYADARNQFLNAKVLSMSSSDGVYTLKLRLDRRDGERTLATNSTIRITVDAEKDWALTSYEVAEDNGGAHWKLNGETTYADYDGVWFPAWHLEKWWRDGDFYGGREYTIVDARFGPDATTAEQFTWRGTDIRIRGAIYSSVPGIGVSMWDGEKIVPWRAGPIAVAKRATPD